MVYGLWFWQSFRFSPDASGLPGLRRSLTGSIPKTLPNPKPQTPNPKPQTPYRTIVPTFSPERTRTSSPGLFILNTITGILFSIHIVKEVRSIIFKFFS